MCKTFLFSEYSCIAYQKLLLNTFFGSGPKRNVNTLDPGVTRSTSQWSQQPASTILKDAKMAKTSIKFNFDKLLNLDIIYIIPRCSNSINKTFRCAFSRIQKEAIAFLDSLRTVPDFAPQLKQLTKRRLLMAVNNSLPSRSKAKQCFFTKPFYKGRSEDECILSLINVSEPFGANICSIFSQKYSFPFDIEFCQIHCVAAGSIVKTYLCESDRRFLERRTPIAKHKGSGGGGSAGNEGASKDTHGKDIIHTPYIAQEMSQN